LESADPWPQFDVMRLDELMYFNSRGQIVFSANRLPHWQQAGGIYFVTFRLADSVPKQLLDRWVAEREGWLRFHPSPWSQEEEREYHERFTGAMERWLDAGHGSCVLRRPECARVVESALRHFDGQRCDLFTSVVMPNHVHALFRLREGHTLEKMVHTWKRFTARRVNAMLGSRGHLWQRDYFDRLVRDYAHFGRCVRYIRRNPEKARLRSGEYLLYESELGREIE
jgi:REP element-mobilizing transposase RayT